MRARHSQHRRRARGVRGEGVGLAQLDVLAARRQRPPSRRAPRRRAGAASRSPARYRRPAAAQAAEDGAGAARARRRSRGSALRELSARPSGSRTSARRGPRRRARGRRHAAGSRPAAASPSGRTGDVAADDPEQLGDHGRDAAEVARPGRALQDRAPAARDPPWSRSPRGYISSTDGAKTTSTPRARRPAGRRPRRAGRWRSPRRARTASGSRTATRPRRRPRGGRRAAATRWPSCRAPIVGTSAIRRSAWRAPTRAARTSTMVRSVLTAGPPRGRRPPVDDRERRAGERDVQLGQRRIEALQRGQVRLDGGRVAAGDGPGRPHRGAGGDRVLERAARQRRQDRGRVVDGQDPAGGGEQRHEVVRREHAGDVGEGAHVLGQRHRPQPQRTGAARAANAAAASSAPVVNALTPSSCAAPPSRSMLCAGCSTNRRGDGPRAASGVAPETCPTHWPAGRPAAPRRSRDRAPSAAPRRRRRPSAGSRTSRAACP